MSQIKEIGVITQQQSLEIEWTIKGISSYTEVDQRLRSPRFSVPGSTWYFELFPYGETEEDSAGWIGLYLMKGSVPPKNVNCDLGIKREDGTEDTLHSDVSYVFECANKRHGFPKYLKRRSVLDDTLTVTCKLRVKDALDITKRLIQLSDDFKKMFYTALGSDTTLKVQNVDILVNKSILASRLPGTLGKDISEKNTGVVNIVDCQPRAFSDFLAYIYSGQFENSSCDLFELYKIAHKYGVEELKAHCVQLIINKLSIDNVLDVAVFADEFADNELKRECQNLFDENFASIVTQDKWGALLKNNSVLVNELLTNMKERNDIKKSKF